MKTAKRGWQKTSGIKLVEKIKTEYEKQGLEKGVEELRVTGRRDD